MRGGPTYVNDQGGRDPILGDLDLYAAACQNQVKGNLVVSRPRYVREEYDEAMFEKVAQALGPEAARYFRTPPLHFEWCSYEPLIEIDYQITKIAMGGSVGRMKHFGEAIAKHDLPLMFKVIFKLGSPGFIMKRLGMAYRQYLRPGNIVAVVDGKKAHVELRDVVYPHYMCAYGIAGWARASIILSGGTNVASIHSSCVHDGDPQCTWQINWR